MASEVDRGQVRRGSSSPRPRGGGIFPPRGRDGGRTAARRMSHAPLRILLREVQEVSHPDAVHRRARARCLQVPWLWGQGVAATDGHVLLPDIAEILRGTESGTEG